MPTPFRAGLVLLVATGGVAVTVAAKRKPPQPCADGDFTVAAADAARLAARLGSDASTFTLGPGSTIALGPCAGPGRIKAKRRATVVKARFAQCGSASKVRLTVTIPAPACGTARGTVRAKRRKPARFKAARTTGSSALCGNGVVDAREACEGLVGCAAHTRCTATCTCETDPAPPATSQALIAAALAAGTIDYSTSLVYRAYALFGDGRLPPEYDGQLRHAEDQGLFLETSRAWGTLPQAARDALQPFVVRPTDPQSVYAPSGTQMIVRPRVAAASLADVKCPFAPGGSVPDWRPTETSHFVVWSCGGGDLGQDPDAGLRAIVADVAEQAWQAITPEAVPPRPDDFASGPAPQGRIDVYVVHGADCKDRQGACVPLETDEQGRRPLAAVVPASPCDAAVNGALTSSAFMLVDAGSVTAAPASGPWLFRYVFAHEFFHVVADAMNLQAQGGGCFDPTGSAQVATSWLSEASAEWAAWAFFPNDGPDQRRNLFLAFQEFRTADSVSLLSVDDQRPYEAFLYPFFLQQEKGGARAPFLAMWKTSAGARNPAALDDHLNGTFGFAEHFRDFTVRNFDDATRLPPSEPRYQAQDAAIPPNELPHVLEPATRLDSARRLTRPATLQPLTGQYEHFTVDDPVRYVRFDVGTLANAAFVDLDALASVRGTWKRKKGEGTVLELCRDDDGEDVQELYLILTNHDRRRGQTVSGSYTVETRAACPAGWSGYIDYVFTMDTVGSYADANVTESADDHLREESTWTFVATTPATSPDGPDTIDAVWNGSFSDTTADVSIPAVCVGYEVKLSAVAAAGSTAGMQQFQIAPVPEKPSQITIAQVASGAPNRVSATGVTHLEQCNLEPTDQAISPTWDDGLGEMLIGLGQPLSPDPSDPNHYAGTATIDIGMGTGTFGFPDVQAANVRWDIRRRR